MPWRSFSGPICAAGLDPPRRQLVEIVPNAARIALECIGNSDALYHNAEHTMLVTMAGHDIMRGRALHTHMSADDYAHVMIACLLHDIGYVRGLFREDDEDGFVIDAGGKKLTLPRGASDASLMPYHVERSKLYVMERLEGIATLDRQRIARCDRGDAISSRGGPGLRRGGLDRPRGGSDRTTGRPQLHPKGQCALLRVRGGRHQSPARL